MSQIIDKLKEKYYGLPLYAWLIIGVGVIGGVAYLATRKKR